MKKLMILAAVALLGTLGSVLSFADDTQRGQEPGTVGQQDSTSGQSQGMRQGGQTQDQTAQRDIEQEKSRLRASRTCTDENGVTFRKGQEGFQDCIQAKLDKLNQQAKSDREQMGGEAGQESGTTSGGMGSEYGGSDGSGHSS